MTTTLTVAGYNSSDVVLKSRAAWLHLMIYFTLTRVNSTGFLRFLLSTFAAYMYVSICTKRNKDYQNKQNLRHSEGSLREKKTPKLIVQRIKKQVWFSWNRRKSIHLHSVLILKKYFFFIWHSFVNNVSNLTLSKLGGGGSFKQFLNVLMWNMLASWCIR